MNKECPVCHERNVSKSVDNNHQYMFIRCPNCGRFELDLFEDISGYNINHLASYLFHNAYYDYDIRYHTILSKEKCDFYNEQYEKGNNTNGKPIHLDSDIVETWYPKSFSERVDYVLLYLNKRTKHIGQPVPFNYQQLLNLLFVDRYEITYYLSQPQKKQRETEECTEEIKYFLNYLRTSGFVNNDINDNTTGDKSLTLMPKGLSRVDELQKNTALGKNAFVAMRFGPETVALREAIRRGIMDAGYLAVFIDEKEHNNLITPEIFKAIKDSKFVVVDLTHQNNGAYLEEGYAMGLGKQVIQLCKKGVQLHFDIAQKNTIIWEKEDDIPSKLTNRIKATIN